MTALRSSGIRMHLWWTALLVLIALGGAGLAVAADRPQDPLQRPELTWRADREARPWLQALADELTLVDGGIAELSRYGRQVLSQIQALDVGAMRAAQAAGDDVSSGLTVALEHLSGVRENAMSALDLSRLGPPTRTAIVLLSGATITAQQAQAHWRDLAADGGRVGGLVDALLRHDGLVFRATTAGRQAQWADALEFLSQAADPLRDAIEARDALADCGDVATLDDLIGRYRTYDEALVALYTYIRETGRQAGERFETLQRAVERAQQALPTDTRTMTVIVSEAAGPSLTEALVAIEAAHGDILDALAAVNP